MESAAIASLHSSGFNNTDLLERLNKLDKEAQVAEVSRQFESIFLRHFLQDSLKPMFAGYLDESGNQQDIYRYFLVDTLANSISQSGAMGMANVLQAQLQESKPQQSE